MNQLEGNSTISSGKQALLDKSIEQLALLSDQLEQSPIGQGFIEELERRYLELEATLKNLKKSTSLSMKHIIGNLCTSIRYGLNEQKENASDETLTPHILEGCSMLAAYLQMLEDFPHFKSGELEHRAPGALEDLYSKHMQSTELVKAYLSHLSGC